MIKHFDIENKLYYSGILIFLISVSAFFYFNFIAALLIPFAICIFFIFLKDIRFAFYSLLLSLPFSFQFLEKYDMPDEPLMIYITGMFFIFCLFNYKKIDLKNILLNPLVIVVLLSTAWLIITVILSENSLLSLKFLAKKSWYIIPFFIFPILLFQNNKVIIRSYQLLFVSMFIVVLTVVVRFSAVGFAFDKVHDPVQPFFQNHVMYGSMVSVVIPFIVAGLFFSRKLSIQWILSLFGIALFLFAVYFSYSRAAWVAVIFSGICYLAVRCKMMHVVILVFFALVFSLVIWLSNNNTYLSYKPKFEKTIMHESLQDHIMATIQGTDISSAERYYRWIAALRMSKIRPWFGVGPNNFYEYYKAYTVTSFKTWVSRNTERSTTHNYFLFLIVEQGYPATILYAILIFIIFYYGQRVYHRLSSSFEKAIVMSAMCCIAAIFINNFFSELLETDKIGSLFYLSLAVIIALDFKQKKQAINL